MGNDNTSHSSTMADEILEILWQWRLALYRDAHCNCVLGVRSARRLYLVSRDHGSGGDGALVPALCPTMGG
jgi:hypothetical protein